MITYLNCEYCSNNLPPSASKCPHCGQPSLFPNVAMASSEQSFLQDRYNDARSLALVSGRLVEVDNFKKTLNESFAIVNRPLSELERLIGGEFEVYATYYHLSEGIRLQKGEEFDSLRQAADSIFFTGYAKEIRFAAISLDSVGLANYGDCSWILREDMISHRASVFEENTTLYYMNTPGIKGAGDLPKGYRAVWADRAKLCVAKLAAKIDTTTSPDKYSSILLHQGATSSDDDFVEVHIFGPMTIRTIQEVTFNPVPTTLSKKDRIIKVAAIEGIKEKLGKYGVKVS